MKNSWNADKMILDLTVVYRSCEFTDEDRDLLFQFINLDRYFDEDVKIDFDFDKIFTFVDTQEFANMFACLMKEQENRGFFSRLFSTAPTLPNVDEIAAFFEERFTTNIPKAIKAVSHNQAVFEQTFDVDSYDDYETKKMVKDNLDSIFNRLLEIQVELKNNASKFETIQENVKHAIDNI